LSPARTAIGFDFGGTAIKAGRADEAGAILGEDSVPNGLDQGPEAAFERMAELYQRLGGADSIGVGIAGLVDVERGVVLESPNLPGVEGVSLRDELAARTALPPSAVHVENDANVAALGEAWLGAAKGEPNVLVVTLGTGVGGGLILDGRAFGGAGMAGEVGHVVVDPGGQTCGCGSTGCLETLASATAARRRALAADLPAGDPGNLELLTARADAGEGPERALLHAVGQDLGRGLGPVVCLFDMRVFVFTGGFAAAFGAMENGIREGIDERSFGSRGSKVRLLAATLGPAAGWIGAARLAFQGP
jgi:glucokinase